MEDNRKSLVRDCRPTRLSVQPKWHLSARNGPPRSFGPSRLGADFRRVMNGAAGRQAIRQHYRERLGLLIGCYETRPSRVVTSTMATPPLSTADTARRST